MGNYLNPGGGLFQIVLNSEIYIDKTNLLQYTNSLIDTEQRFLCISRPRRFGKTMTLKMLCAYYGQNSNAENLFVDKFIEKDRDLFFMHANKYNVIMLDITKWLERANKNVSTLIDNVEKTLIKEITRKYSEIDYLSMTSLMDVCSDVYRYTARKFVILIDEWDAIFRENADDVEGQKRYLDFLRSWLKDQEYVALAYMTGILPIKKYGKHSALNMFREFTMEDPKGLEEYVGFTGEEVKSLCEKYNMDYSQCKAWYNGYSFRRIKEIYNPLSVVEAMLNQWYNDYWNKTETYEALKVYIELNYQGLKDIILRLMSGERYKIDTSNYSNDMTNFNSADDVLTLLIHLGYLGYDNLQQEVFIPNNEIRTEFAASIKNSEMFTEVAKAIKCSNELIKETLAGNEKRVAELIELAHLENSHLQYNDENALAYTISLAYYTARNEYNIIRELPSGLGFADLVFLPLPHCCNKSPMIVELKWNRSANTAIKQIKNKQYIDALKGYNGKIILVGINYSKKTKKHTCKIESVIVC